MKSGLNSSFAANTEAPNAAATVGRIPNYNLLDISAQLKPSPSVYLKIGVQNATNVRYFTRRAGGGIRGRALCRAMDAWAWLHWALTFKR